MSHKKFTFFKSTYLKPLISLRLSSVLEMNLLENCDFVFLKEDIKRFIWSTKLDPRDIRGLRYVDLKKVNFFVGHPVYIIMLPPITNLVCVCCSSYLVFSSTAGGSLLSSGLGIEESQEGLFLQTISVG